VDDWPKRDDTSLDMAIEFVFLSCATKKAGVWDLSIYTDNNNILEYLKNG
jgi:hypothetical protein